MRRIKHRVATYRQRYDHKDINTREGWAKKGFVVKQRRKGEVMYTNGFLGKTAEYYYEDDVKQDAAGACRYLEHLRRERSARRRELAKTKKERAYAEEVNRIKEESLLAIDKAEKRGSWLGFLTPKPRIVIFDCETSGLDCEKNVMLSLSFQLIEFEKISEKGCLITVIERADYYFEWPEDNERITHEAIAVNGLTKERLAELGTTDRMTALLAFLDALSRARMAVAHNASFDCGFIDSAAADIDIQVKWPRIYDTMERMTNKCKLYWYDGAHKYKWPRLSELADCLNVDVSDIEFHFSASDVEVTKRCLVKIIEEGLDYPFTPRL